MRAFELEANPNVIFFTVVVRQIQVIPQLSGHTFTSHQTAAQDPYKKDTPSFDERNYTQIHKLFKINRLKTALGLELEKEGK
jgi:hypothetical protein